MQDPAITAFEIVHEYFGKKNKVEWRAVQTAINQGIKENKGADPKVIKQNVFDAVKVAIDVAIINFNQTLIAKISESLSLQFPNKDAIAAEVVNNSPELKQLVETTLHCSLGKLEHGLNETHWEMIDRFRKLIQESVAMGERVGQSKAKEQLKESMKKLL